MHVMLDVYIESLSTNSIYYVLSKPMKHTLIKMTKEFANSLLSFIGVKLVRSRDVRLKSIYRSDKWKASLLVNIGSGGFAHKSWTNLDIPNEFYRRLQKRTKFIPYDICSMSQLPFEDGSVDVFYASHVIEHLSDDNCRFLLAEAWKKLKPGGVMRITCPDMELQHRAYLSHDVRFWSQPSPWLTSYSTLEERFVEHLATLLLSPHRERFPEVDIPILSIDEIRNLLHQKPIEKSFDKIVGMLPPNANSLYPQGHCNWFTTKKLISVLGDSGFAHAFKSGFGQSSLDILRDTTLFDNTCPELSLYVEAIK